MQMVVQRQQRGALAISGEMFIGGTHACYTLENLLDAIPAGTYAVTLYDSPKFGRVMPLLMDVPGRSYIEIHYGTYPENYHGCIGVGQLRDLATEEIFNTRAMFDALFPAIEAAVDAEGCWITIND
jgi:hypothetical protein